MGRMIAQSWRQSLRNNRSYVGNWSIKAKASLYSKKAMENYRSNGIHTVIRKSLIKLEALSKGDGLYQTWLKENRVTKKELNQQRKTVFQENIKFSLVVPLYKTDKYLLKALVDSVLAQTYSNWELCLSFCTISLLFQQVFKSFICNCSTIQLCTYP